MSTFSTSATKAAAPAPNPHLLRAKFLPVEPVLDQPIVAFMRLRHMARSAHEIEASYRGLLHVGRRARNRLDAGQFNAHRIAQLDEHINAVDAELKVIRDHIQRVGAVLIDLGPEIDKVTTLDQHLELLNCNHADRDSIDESNITMVLLMAAYCVEDSAEHRKDQRNDRPLHAAVNAEMHRVMFDTPEGNALSDKLFDELSRRVACSRQSHATTASRTERCCARRRHWWCMTPLARAWWEGSHHDRGAHCARQPATRRPVATGILIQPQQT